MKLRIKKKKTTPILKLILQSKLQAIHMHYIVSTIDLDLV